MSHKVTVAILTVLTVINVVRLNREPEPEPIVVSGRSVGTRLPGLVSREAGCRVLVVFRSDCPFCKAAAAREVTTHEQDHLPTKWVAAPDDVAWESYRDRVHPSSSVELDAGLYSLLEVQAVPAGFLIDGEGVLRRAWPYQGNEVRAELEERCREPGDLS